MASFDKTQTLHSYEQLTLSNPPDYAISELYDPSTASLHPEPLPTTHISKPIVVPQTTNIFFIKTFSPFARAYSPALAQLPKPISQEDFLTFIDGLNEAFLSPPLFQAMHVIGGGLLGSQILPAQAVGGVFQISSILGSAGFSIIRVRKYLKRVNADMFAPRGLTAVLMSTKKMVSAINFTDTDAKGKLVLPPLEDVSELEPFIQSAASKKEHATIIKEDPRRMRLKALETHVAPLTFDIPAQTLGPMAKYGGAPLRWINKKELGKLDKARTKSLKKREGKAPEVQRELEKNQSRINELDQQISAAKMNYQRASLLNDGAVKGKDMVQRHPVEDNMLREIQALEDERLAEEAKRNEAVRKIYEKGDKKLIKTFKKEQKIANRILWVVIRKEGVQDAAGSGDFVHVDSV